MTQLDATQLHEHHLNDVSFGAEEGADPHVARPLSRGSQNDSPPANEPSSNGQHISAEAAKIQSNLKARKRTKTGCLTCRKRRIKCGEERPTCANCIKSKRSCEGYAPRLTFKDPLGAFRPGWGTKGHGAHFQGYPHPNGAIGQYARQPMPLGTQNQLPIIAPRPLPSDATREVYLPQHGSGSAWSAGLQTSLQHEVPISIQPSTDLPPRIQQMYQGQNGGHGMQYMQAEGVNGFSAASYSAAVPAQRKISQDVSRFEAHRPPVPLWPLTNAPTELNQGHLQTSTSFVDQARNLPAATMPTEYYHSSGPTNETQNFDGLISMKQPESQMQSAQIQGAPQTAQTFSGGTHSLQYPAAYTWGAEDNEHIYNTQNSSHQAQTPQFMNSSIQLFKKQMGYERIKHQFTVDNDESEDDMFDVESDEEEVHSTNRIALAPQNDVGLMLALAASQDDRALRSYTTFLHEPNVLSNYHPTYTASPLMDSTTARVFCHFITATGPSISIYERHPTNPSVMFTGAPVPSSQQALWTYTLPMRALSNQALLHAMLAMSSLHISALQKTPPTASLRHYHYCLRKLSRALAVPSRRTDVCTIAATLILAHYEATTAEHSKWNRHLAGARQLLMEVDFKGITKQIREEKARRSRQKEYPIWYYSRDTLMNHDRFEQNPQVQNDDSADETLVSQLMGYKINYNEFGRILDDRAEFARTPLTEKDKETYKIHCDLFWWYAKQDVYQSIVSGNRLLLPYDRWGHCPPRAPIGKLDAIYGTMDHVVLLMGRIADFASRDQIRKRRLMKKNGGQWIPSPGLVPNAPPGAPPPAFPISQTSPTGAIPSPTQPPMYGMIPPIPPPQTPDRFMQIPRDQIYIPPVIDEDTLELEGAATQAEHEWQEIQDALNLLEKSLGPAYAPLPDYLTTPIQTPFGPALQFRTWSIADIWVMFYTGRIVAARMHPSMPPAAMMAAGIAARQTAHWANEVGRICCGLQIPPADQPLNPAVGAALMESTLGMFFAGVQFTDPLQRSTIITRLITIADMTGLQSSALIAAGCELCWSKMGEAGRGPPYQPTMDKRAKDDRVAGRQAQEGDELNRKMVYLHPGTRTHYGMGILSFDEDIEDSIRQDLSGLNLVKH